MHHEDHLLLVLHEPPKPNEKTRRGRFYWRDASGQWRSSERGASDGVSLHLDEFDEMLSECEALENEAQSPEEYFQALERVAPLHRALCNLHQVLSDARKAVPADRVLINWRDRAYDLKRTAELTYSSARNGLDFAMAKRTEEHATSARRMSIASHRLNLLAAFFFPLATIASLLGMQTWPMQTNGSPIVFFTLLAAGLFAGALLTLFVSSGND